MTGHLTSPDRVSHAQKAAGEAGIDALLVTPGPDLRWLTGYDALPLERLTCLVVPGDAVLFERVLVNLLENAAKYTPCPLRGSRSWWRPAWKYLPCWPRRSAISTSR